MTADDLAGLTRDELNAKADHAGVEDPASLANKDEVIAAITAKEAQPAAVKYEPRPFPDDVTIEYTDAEGTQQKIRGRDGHVTPRNAHEAAILDANDAPAAKAAEETA